MSRFIAPVLAVLALLFAASCSSYRFTASETLVRFVPQDDVVLVMETEHGIQASGAGPNSVQQAVEALTALAAGRRKYPADGGLISFDFDDPATVDAFGAEHAAMTREIVDDVHVEESGLYLDADNRLSFYRLTRVEHCARLLGTLSDFMDAELSKPEELEKPFKATFPFFDEASWQSTRAAIVAGHRWLKVENGAVVLDVPMTSANAARCLAWLLSESEKKSENVQLFQQASSLEVKDGHALLRFGEASQPVVRFDSTPGGEYDDGVQKRLERLGTRLGGAGASDHARAKFEAAGASRPK